MKLAGCNVVLYHKNENLKFDICYHRVNMFHDAF